MRTLDWGWIRVGDCYYAEWLFYMAFIVVVVSVVSHVPLPRWNTWKVLVNFNCGLRPQPPSCGYYSPHKGTFIRWVGRRGMYKPASSGRTWKFFGVKPKWVFFAFTAAGHLCGCIRCRQTAVCGRKKKESLLFIRLHYFSFFLMSRPPFTALWIVRTKEKMGGGYRRVQRKG